jgi:hypothetical protein
VPPPHHHGPPADPVACGALAYGSIRTSFDALPALRQHPGSLPDRPGLASSIRSADEQTLLALAAVLRALEAPALRGRSFADWGVIAAPRYPGRMGVAAVLERFRRQGTSGMSPLIIPMLSLHSMSGTLSMALGCHGPNFGIGGGEGHLGEALLAATATVREDGCSGMWLVMTECDPEPIPDVQGRSTTPAEGHAVALALVRETTSGVVLCLRKRDGATTASTPTLAGLATFLEGGAMMRAAAWRCPLPGGGEIEVIDRQAADEVPQRRRVAG